MPETEDILELAGLKHPVSAFTKEWWKLGTGLVNMLFMLGNGSCWATEGRKTEPGGCFFKLD